MIETPKTRYARSTDRTFIAYQVFGDGPDLLIAFPWISHLELFWDDPDVGSWLRSIGRFARVIVMDQRGIGLSDRMTQMIDLETKVDDVLSVLDAAGSSRATLYGQGVDGGAICAMFAATYPERSVGLAFWSGETCGGSQADYPWRIEQAELDRFITMIADTWGDEDFAGPLMSEAGLGSIADDPVGRARWARTMRNAASRGDALIHERMFDETDFRSILPAIHVPSVILQPAGSTWNVDAAEWMASQIIGAEVIRLPDQHDFPPYMGPTGANLDALRTFLGGLHAAEAEFERSLATVLFTDIVGSTERAASLGDRAWRDLLERHHGVVRAMLARYRGTEVDTAGDGFLATFDGPARAVRCAQGIVQATEPLRLQIRAGVHTGEVETIDGKVGGIAVNIGARVGAAAGPSEVYASSTVKDLTAGSGLVFEDAGEHELKGVPDRWHLYRVVG